MNQGAMSYGGMPARYSIDRHSIDDEDEITIERFNQLAEYCEDIKEKYSSLAETHGRTNSRLAALERERSDAVRAHRIHSLSSQFPGLIDFDEEANKVLYSAGSEMDDDDFEAHCDTIERFAAKAAPPTDMIPDGIVQEEERPTTERYSAEVNQEVVRRITAALHNNQPALDYDQTLDAVLAERKS